MRFVRHHGFLVVAGAALLLASSGGVASAQFARRPMPDPNGQVEQIMLAGEADAVAQYRGYSD